MPKIIVALLLSIAAFAVLSLAFGAAYLGVSLPGGLPLGNALTALGLCSLAGAAVGLSARGTAPRAVSLASLVAAAAWLPISVILAGNLALNFSGERGSAWFKLTFVVVVGVLVALVWAMGAAILAKRRGSSAT